MRNSLRAVVFSALSVMSSAGLHAGTHQHGEMNAAGDALAQRIVKGTGVVKDIDFSSKKIMVSHEAILVAGWPAMTMRSTFVNTDDGITMLEVDTHVNFTSVQQGNTSLLKNINDTQSRLIVRSECNPHAC